MFSTNFPQCHHKCVAKAPHLVSVFVRYEKVHCFLEKLPEGLPPLAAKAKMLAFDQGDELVIVNDTIIVQINLLDNFVFQWLRH